MIVKRTWIKTKYIDAYPAHYRKLLWEGWFLFGFIPLYMRRTIVRW